VSIVQKYLNRQILSAIGFVLLAFISLFLFFDLVGELGDVGRDGYRFEDAILIVLLGVPARVYELLPIAALIGTIYALAQLAANSEFTILRVSGLSTVRAAGMVLLPGVFLVITTFFVGEVVVTRAEAITQAVQAKIRGTHLVQAFRSGLWVKDRIADNNGAFLTRFVNIGEMRADAGILNVKIYEFDSLLRLRRISFAARGEFVAPDSWRLADVVETRFGVAASGSTIPTGTVVEKHAESLWHSELNPGLLRVLQAAPERMGAGNLGQYIQHLEENRQKTDRYQIAFWKKIIYPFAVLVMMALALPFAYLHVRTGGISLKIFAGIMLGIGFYLLNNLFSHLGLINTWPPLVSAALPSLVALAAAMAGLRWVERH